MIYIRFIFQFTTFCLQKKNISYSIFRIIAISLPRHKPSRHFINSVQSASGGKVRPTPSIDAAVNFVFISISIGQEMAMLDFTAICCYF